VRDSPGPGSLVRVGGSWDAAEEALCVQEVVDIEENVWAPKYGLKGMIDASLRTAFHSNPRQVCCSDQPWLAGANPPPPPLYLSPSLFLSLPPLPLLFLLLSVCVCLLVCKLIQLIVRHWDDCDVPQVHRMQFSVILCML
jgi:hypothetical protein